MPDSREIYEADGINGRVLIDQKGGRFLVYDSTYSISRGMKKMIVSKALAWDLRDGKEGKKIKLTGFEINDMKFGTDKPARKDKDEFDDDVAVDLGWRIGGEGSWREVARYERGKGYSDGAMSDEELDGIIKRVDDKPHWW
jgi:hypothetical protein